MEGQGNILKTLLVAAVVYTLALGAPVKRDTSNSTVAEACAAATDIENITNCPDIRVITPDTTNENSAAEYLWKILPENNFTVAVCEAVRKCLNHRDSYPEKCTLAAAAMELHDTINKFIVKHGKKKYAQPLRIDCCTSTDEVEVEGPLCYASVYTRKMLAKIDWKVCK